MIVCQTPIIFTLQNFFPKECRSDHQIYKLPRLENKTQESTRWDPPMTAPKKMPLKPIPTGMLNAPAFL